MAFPHIFGTLSAGNQLLSLFDENFNVFAPTTGKVLTFTNSITLSGTDATVMTFPSTSATMARIDTGQTFTGDQFFTGSDAAIVVRVNQATAATYVTAANNSHASNPLGIQVGYSAASPNDTGHNFLDLEDASAIRASFRSNGGLANFSANNANLSDERLKTAIVDAPSYYDKLKAMRFRTFLYKDQSDATPNLGVIAQEMEAVAPELVDPAGFGKTPEDGIPLKAIYQTDFQYALGKALQETIAALEALQGQFAAYVSAHP